MIGSKLNVSEQVSTPKLTSREPVSEMLCSMFIYLNIRNDQNTTEYIVARSDLYTLHYSKINLLAPNVD